MEWHVSLLPEAEKELQALPVDMQARFLHVAELIEAFGPQRTGMPYVRHVEDKLWEIRMSGRDGIARAIYFNQSGRRLTVLHVFVKKTQKTPRLAIETARRRMNEE